MKAEKSRKNALEVRLEGYGSPSVGVQLRQREMEELEPDEVLVENQLATINPADLNLIEGRYGIKPTLPLVLGQDGVGEVVEVGREVTTLSPGCRVISPVRMGSWCSAYVAKETSLVRVSQGIDPHQAATLSVNPATAWRLLHDFVPLRCGEWILQNGGNTEVGRAVAQIAREKGWRVASIVRQVEGAEGDLVFGEEEPFWEKVPEKCRLALNCVGGPIVKRMFKGLAEGACLVTYGALSKQPMEVGAGPLIFQDLAIKGFWRTRWVTQAPLKSVREMYENLSRLAEKGLFHPRIAGEYPLTAIQDALRHGQDPNRKGKIFLDCG